MRRKVDDLMADFVPESVPRSEAAATATDDDVGVEVVQCECWWTLKDETWGNGERVDYADDDCPVHARE